MRVKVEGESGAIYNGLSRKVGNCSRESWLESVPVKVAPDGGGTLHFLKLPVCHNLTFALTQFYLKPKLAFHLVYISS